MSGTEPMNPTSELVTVTMNFPEDPDGDEPENLAGSEDSETAQLVSSGDLYGAVGIEVAAVLRSAHDAALEIARSAEEDARRIREEAAAAADRIREEAEAEAARVREEAAAEKARAREEAVAEATRAREATIADFDEQMLRRSRDAEEEAAAIRQAAREAADQIRRDAEQEATVILHQDIARLRDFAAHRVASWELALERIRAEHATVVSTIEAEVSWLRSLTEPPRPGDGEAANNP